MAPVQPLIGALRISDDRFSKFCSIIKELTDFMQQEMNSHQEMPNQPRPAFVYEGEQAQNPSAYHMYGQKIVGAVSGQAPTAGQRLALAIVSLSLLIFLIFGLILFAAVSNTPNWAFVPILFIFVLFSAVATAINIVFNRRV